MWCAFARATALFAVVAAAAACGPRALDVSLSFDTSACMMSVPAGGSILYQVEANGGTASLCGGCLPVDNPIADADGMVAFLKAQAPTCSGVHPGTTLGIRVTGWTAAGCPGGNPPRFCADAPSQLVPDGSANATLSFNLICKSLCSAVCVPTTCMAQGKDCGPISDGCNMVLDCGTCKPPLRCGAITPNVCGR